MGSGGAKHQISAVMNNHQDKHQSTMVESSCKINQVKLKVLFDHDAADSLISPYALDKCVLETC